MDSGLDDCLGSSKEAFVEVQGAGKYQCELNPFGVKHPYLGYLNLDAKHTIFVMRDVGETVLDLLSGPDAGSRFRARWRGSAGLRSAFLQDVAHTALNLADRTGHCHNDIRPPNIAFSAHDGRFCLIDFDLVEESILPLKPSAFSPPLMPETLWGHMRERMMLYSVAQVAVSVFYLDSAFTLQDVSAAVRIWPAERGEAPGIGEVEAEFERWVWGKGRSVQAFVSAVREACWSGKRPACLPPPGRLLRQFLDDVVKGMLSLGSD